MRKGLTAKQLMFVKEYLVDLNGKQAAIRAGYSEKTAESQASRLLSNAKVYRAIADSTKERTEKLEITVEYVLKGLVEVAERCLQKKPVMEFDRAERCMVQATDDQGRDVWQFDSTGANRAFELLGKYKQMFTDKVQHSGDINVSGVLRVPGSVSESEWLAENGQG